MADWSRVAQGAGWTCSARTIRVQLGARRHTVHVSTDADEIIFTAMVPGVGFKVLDYLVANRRLGLAYWAQEGNTLLATSRCSVNSGSELMEAYIRETAALADWAELSTSEVDS